MSNVKQVNEFLTQLADIKHYVDVLSASANEHFNTNPETINWTDVGTLEKVANDLHSINEFLASANMVVPITHDE